MKLVNILLRIKKGIEKIFLWLSIFLLFTIFILMLLQVFRRYVLNDAYFWVEEVCRLAQIWIVFLASPLVLKRAEHPSFGGVPACLNNKGKKLIWILSMLLVIMTGWWIGYYGIQLMYTSTYESANGIPRWMAILPAVIGGCWTVVEAVYKIITIIRLNPEEVKKWKV